LSANSFLLFSRHRSAGVPMCNSRTISFLCPYRIRLLRLTTQLGVCTALASQYS
jgi:hypothetical protein